MLLHPVYDIITSASLVRLNTHLRSFNGFFIFLGDGGYPYAAQHLSLGAEGAKTTSKYGENE